MFQAPATKLQKYAQVLVNFALRAGEGIKQGDVVHLSFPTSALPLAQAVYVEILRSGGHPIIKMSDDVFTKALYEYGNDEQLKFFPRQYLKSLVDTIDHRIAIICDADPLLLKQIDPRKLMLANSHTKTYRRWLDRKEDQGKLSWTLALYPTPAMAAEANLTPTEYWQQIVKACFLDQPDPIQHWRNVFGQMQEIKQSLDELPIQKLHIEAARTDLWINLGKSRQWLFGSGNNIPSFEIFTSPDWRGAEGRIYFDLPLYRYGNIIRDIELEFKNGRVIQARAGQNEELLLAMIKQPGADKIGEFSLTDRRFSRIDRFMAETLFDENFGGKCGNTHIALGAAYHDAYRGDPAALRPADYRRLGFNESSEHCDIIATSDRQVSAVLVDGSKRVIYQNGQFSL